jgi:hypothetical protein
MGMQETVIPFAYPSVTAADILQTVMKRENLFADMIYIDGSHLYLDVLLDLQNYWPLLKDGGVMFGDDWTCPDVREAVLEFVQENKYPLTIHPNQVHWFIDKTVFKPINLT